MKLLERFLFNFDDEIVGTIKMKSFYTIPRVNSLYYVNKNWDIVKNSQVVKYQEVFSYIVWKQKKSKKLIDKPILIELNFHQLLKPNKNWNWIDKREILDIDAILKTNLDVLNGTIIKDDDLVYWIVCFVTYNKFSNTFFEMKLYEYDKEEFDTYIELVKNKLSNKEINSWIITLPKEMSFISFNKGYERWVWYVKLTKESKEYKEFLKKEIKDNFEDNDKSNDFLLWIYEFYDNNWDLDNKVKLFQDCFNKIVFTDDKQIKMLILKKEKSLEKYVKYWFYEINDIIPIEL